MRVFSVTALINGKREPVRMVDHGQTGFERRCQKCGIIHVFPELANWISDIDVRCECGEMMYINMSPGR
jgi:RNase P subunit RPR2